MRPDRSRSLTLVELVVVLLIVVAVSTLALRSTTQLVDQGRFDATERQLDAIESAVLGDYGRPGPLPESPFAGFVADTGGLPRLYYSDSEVSAQPYRDALQLGELWSRTPPDDALATPRLQTYQITDAASIDTSVVLGTGWRGPYVRLSAASATTDGITDGWGNPFQFSIALSETYAPTTFASDSPIRALRSLGSNSGLTSDPYNRSFRKVFQDQATGVDLVTSSVSGRIFGSTSNLGPDPADGNTVVIAIFGPDPDDGSLTASFAVLTVPASQGPPLQFVPADFSGPTVTCGPRVIRAYQGDNLDPLVPPILSQQTGDANGKRSQIYRLRLRPGGEIQDLVLDQDPLGRP